MDVKQDSNLPNKASDKSHQARIPALPRNKKSIPLNVGQGSSVAGQVPFQTLHEENSVRREPFDEKSFKQMIREMNLKVTDQRLLILQALHEGRHHVTAQEVFEIVSSRDAEIGFATVYRFLRTLTEHKFVIEVRMGGLPARYELSPKEHHDHLTCVQCSAIYEFENHEIEKLQERVATEFGFKLTSHVLELYGVCPVCQKKNS